MDSAQKIRVAINGFGRIGRNAFKVALEEHSDEVEIVAINDLTEPKVLAHLLEYDTAYGHWDKAVSFNDHSVVVDGQNYPIYAEKDPTKLPWGSLNVDVVIESTGRFTDEEGMKQHLTAGAKKVVLSAPAKGGNIGTFLIGVNHDKYQDQQLINNASCTTNCIAPVAAIIEDKFGIQKALMTTIHSVTAEQNLVDGPPPGGKSGDLRRARAAYANMIPTTTGAAISVTEAIPELKGLFDGRAIRVPTIVGSISDFTFLLKRKTTLEEVNQAIKEACDSPRWKGVVAWTQEPLVSSDIIGRSESAIVDLELTQIIDGDLVKIFAWYDNEWGYSNRLIEQVINVGKSKTAPSSTVATTPPAPTEVAPATTVSLPSTDGLGVVRPSTDIDTSKPPGLPPLATPAPLAPSHQPTAFFDHNNQFPPASSVSSPAVSNGIGATSLPLTPANSVSPIPASSPVSAPPEPQTSTSSPADVTAALNMPPAPADPPAKADEPKIDDHVVPEGAPAPKNNPFLSWFK